MEQSEIDETKLPIVMQIIEQMATLAGSMSMKLGMDEENDKIFMEQMGALDTQLKAAMGKGLDDCELFLDYPAYTTLEIAAKRVMLPPEESDLVKLLEQRLSPYGFQFLRYQDGRWTFQRVIDGVAQNVVIQGNLSQEFLLEIYSDRAGCPLRMREITDHAPAYGFDFIPFKNEEERAAALHKIADIVIQYGIDKLNQMTEK